MHNKWYFSCFSKTNEEYISLVPVISMKTFLSRQKKTPCTGELLFLNWNQKTSFFFHFTYMPYVAVLNCAFKSLQFLVDLLNQDSTFRFFDLGQYNRVSHKSNVLFQSLDPSPNPFVVVVHICQRSEG